MKVKELAEKAVSIVVKEKEETIIDYLALRYEELEKAKSIVEELEKQYNEYMEMSVDELYIQLKCGGRKSIC